MKISDSAVQMYASHASIEKHQKSESLTMWVGDRQPPAEAEGRGRGGRQSVLQFAEKVFGKSSHVHLSHEAQKNQPVKAVAPEVAEEDQKFADLNIRILQKFFEKLTGRKMQIFNPEEILGDGQQKPAEIPTEAKTDVEPINSLAGQQGQEGEGYGLIYDYYESHYEYESTSFASEGKILTEDGREIEFSVELNMSREFYTEQSVNIRMGDALKDPLVVNFAGTAAELTQTKFAFDIDMDGRDDQLSFVKNNGGLLVLDKNEDGIVNDGSELFGPTTGDGFSELALYDLDKNGWIDENDDIFSKLRIWMKNEEGEDKLMALGEKGVGAIYLGHVDTPFSLKDDGNNLLGQVAASGVFLHENGQVGTIQHVDFSI